ncbi:MAG: hypothetical protein RIT28_254 [Pseudomonadota bacterium]
MSALIRLGLAAFALAFAVGCSTLARVNGAKTLDPGQTQIGVSGSLQQGSNPLSTGTIPLPQGEVFVRRGVAPNLDMGARLYLVGVGMDVRYRFYEGERLHLALNPGYGLVVVPFAGSVRGSGSLDVRVPLIAEFELGERSSVAGGPTLVLRRQRNDFTWFIGAEDTARVLRLDAYAGAGVRYAYSQGRIILGVNADLYAQTARHAGPAYAVGADLSIIPQQVRKAPRR